MEKGFHIPRKPYHLGIQQKLMLGFLAMIAAVLFLTSIAYEFSVRQANVALIEAQLSSLSYAGELLNKELADLEMAFSFISSSPQIQDMLAPTARNDKAYLSKLQDSYRVINDNFFRTGKQSDFASLRIYGGNGVVIREGGNLQFERAVNGETLRFAPWNRIGESYDGEVAWFGIQHNPYYPERFLPLILSPTGEHPEIEQIDASHLFLIGYMGNITDTRTMRPLGLAFLAFYPSVFGELLEDFYGGEGESAFVVDGDGMMVYSQSPSQMGTAYGENEILREAKTETGYFFSHEEQGENLTVYCSLVNGWYLVRRTDFSSLTSARRMDFAKNQALILLLAAVSLFVWYLITRRVIGPIRKLSRAMDRVIAGNLDVRVEDNGAEDETGVMLRDFNCMTERLGHQFRQLVEEQAQNKQLEFIALQAQLNPHFLQNTLNSIRWMAVIQRANNIKELTDALSRLLINVTSKVEQFITVEDEIRILQDYIYIQKIRYGDKFSVWYQVDPGMEECLCLKMLLQPVLENAIYHGIEPRERRGVIFISIRAEDGMAAISIRDDGVGISKRRIDEIEGKGEGGPRFSGIGLRNIRDRLSLIYAEKGTLEITGQPGEWTDVTIRFPIEYEKVRGNGTASYINS